MINEEKRQIILQDPLKTNAAVLLIKKLIMNLQNEDNSDLFLNLCRLYLYQHSNIDPILTSSVFRSLFKHLNNFKKYQEGYVFFSRVSEILNKNIFFNAQAYTVYFAYQLKQYDLIENTLNTLLIQFQSESYGSAYDFCMLNFYKGLILLSMKV